MSDTYFPFAAGAGAASAQDRWAKMAPLWAPNGLTPDSPFVTLGSGLTWVIPDGLTAWIKGFCYFNDGAQNKTAANNVNSNPRIDRLVLRLDTSGHTITPVILQGTPASSPVAPSMGLNDILVARATCPGSASAQNYSNIVQEWSPVSSARGRHAWTSGTVAAVGAGGQTITTWTEARNGGLASMASGTSLTLNRAGIWMIRLWCYSDAPTAGISSLILDWPGGPELDSPRVDGWRGTGFTGAGILRQQVVFAGIVRPAEAAVPIQCKLIWNTAGSATNYLASLYADYLGG